MADRTWLSETTASRSQLSSRRNACAHALVVIVALLGASACASTPAASGEDAGASQLDARMLAMVDTRQHDTALVDLLLADASSARRARAALAVGQVRLHERYARIRRLLVDADTAVAGNAAFALGIAQDTASVVALGRAVAGAPDAVAIEAAWALGQIGEPARALVAFALGEGISQPLVASTAAQRSGAVRAELLMASIKIRSISPTLLLPWLGDSAVEAVRGAAYVFGRSRSPVAVRAMLALRNHKDELVRQHVARILSRGAAGDSLSVRAREALSELLADTSARVRANAARSVASFGVTARADVERALHDADENVRLAALEGIGGVLGNDAAAWQRAWDLDTNFTFRRTLAAAASRAGSKFPDQLIGAWKSDRDWRFRSAYLEATTAGLAQSPFAERLQRVEWALADADGRVRATAIGALNSSQSQSEMESALRDRLRVALRDGDVQVRATATNALSRAPQSQDLPLVIDAYQLALKDVDADARMAALRYIASAWTRDNARMDGSIRDRLAALAPSDEPLERAIVRNVTPMRTWNARGDIRTARPLSEYMQIAQRYFSRGARMPQAVIRTERGDIRLQLYGDAAPLTVDAFTRLARQGFYRNTRFHRVVPNFVAQDGDPRGDGTGGAGFFLRDEPSRRRHLRGCLGVATSGPETGGSQYYLCHSPQPHLDGAYTVFGQVMEGYSSLYQIVQGDRILTIEIR